MTAEHPGWWSWSWRFEGRTLSVLQQEGEAVLIVIYCPGYIELPVRCGTLLGGREAVSLLHGALSWSIVGKRGSDDRCKEWETRGKRWGSGGRGEAWSRSEYSPPRTFDRFPLDEVDIPGLVDRCPV